MLETPIRKCIEPIKNSEHYLQELNDFKLLMYFSRHNRWVYLDNQSYQITFRNRVQSRLNRQGLRVFDKFSLTQHEIESLQRDIYRNIDRVYITWIKVNSCIHLDKTHSVMDYTIDKSIFSFKNTSSVEINYNLINFDKWFHQTQLKIDSYQYIKNLFDKKVQFNMILTATASGDHLLVQQLLELFKPEISDKHSQQILKSLFKSDPRLDLPFYKEQNYAQTLEELENYGYNFKAQESIFQKQLANQKRLWFWQPYHAATKTILDYAHNKQWFKEPSMLYVK